MTDMNSKIKKEIESPAGSEEKQRSKTKAECFQVFKEYLCSNYQ